MPLTKDIMQAAELLGKQLSIDPCVREFVRFNEMAQQDAEVVELEKKLNNLYQKLAQQQQNGEALDRVELDEYYDLKHQVQIHPLVEARDNQLETVKNLFTQIAQHITAILGVDYPALAK